MAGWLDRWHGIGYWFRYTYIYIWWTITSIYIYIYKYSRLAIPYWLFPNVNSLFLQQNWSDFVDLLQKTCWIHATHLARLCIRSFYQHKGRVASRMREILATSNRQHTYVYIYILYLYWYIRIKCLHIYIYIYIYLWTITTVHDALPSTHSCSARICVMCSDTETYLLNTWHLASC